MNNIIIKNEGVIIMSLIPGVPEERDVPAEIIEEAGVGGAASLEHLLRREAMENEEAMEILFTFDGVPASRTEIERQADQGILPDQYRR